MKHPKTVKLGEIAKVTSGGTPDRKKSEYYAGGTIPWVKTGDLKVRDLFNAGEHITELGVKNSSATIFPVNTVLIALYGATIGASSILKIPAATNQACGAIMPSQSLIPNFLYYYVVANREKLVEAGVGGAQPNISGQILKNLKIPLPDLDTQRHIAAVLDRADALRQKDRQLLNYYEQLPQAVFLEMFGDPVRNEKGWEVKKFGELGEARLGKMLDAKQQSGNHRFPYLGNSNVQWGRFNLVNLSEMDFNEKDRVEFALKYGDLLVCEGGEVGRVAIWREEMSNCFFQKAIHRVRFNADMATPEYAQSLLKLFAERNGFKDYVTVATIAHLTGVKLKSIPVPVPPIKEQQRFGNIHADLCTQIDKAKQQLATSEALFQSLLHESFGEKV